MDITTLGTLVLLALADSTSFGTLLIPVWLLLATGRPRPGRILIYLATVASFYFIVGILLSIGARLLLDDLQRWIASQPGGAVMIVLGALLIGASVVVSRRNKRAGAGATNRLLAWRERVVGAESGSVGPLIGLALAATAIEVASLLPYLMAIGIMSGAGVSVPLHGLILAGYCVLMIAPAMVLLILRLVAHRQIAPVLRKVNDWLTKQAGEMTVWILAIVGILLIRFGTEPFGGIGAILQSLRGGIGS